MAKCAVCVSDEQVDLIRCAITPLKDGMSMSKHCGSSLGDILTVTDARLGFFAHHATMDSVFVAISSHGETGRPAHWTDDSGSFR